MLKQFPIRLSIKILIATILVLVVVRLFVYPQFVRMQEKIPALWSYYSGKDIETVRALERDKTILAEFEKNVAAPADNAKKGVGYHDFLQDILKKHGIAAVKINSGNQIVIKTVKRDDFKLQFTTTYHTLGSVSSDIENGPFFCSVKPLHIFSKSLLNYTLDVDMSLSFYRLAK